MWFLDTGNEDCLGYVGWDCLRLDQLLWLREENLKINDSSKGRGFIFMHIPIFEYVNLYNNHQFYGRRGEDVCCQAINTGLLSYLKE